MLTDFLYAGVHEVVNNVRLQAYLRNIGSPFTTGPDICGCDTVTREMLEDGAAPGSTYDTPATDPAPWYDVDLPESALFLGFMPLSMTGLDDNTRARGVTNAVGGGGIFGPVRALPRTITVTGLLIGASCCAAEFGIQYLAEALAGCNGSSCDGDCLTMYNCCPDAPTTKAVFDAAHRRSFRRAALVSGPTVTARVGTGGGCARGTCGMNGDIIQVEFVIVAASPYAWADPIPRIDVGLPVGGTGDCIEWCLSLPASGSSACEPGECTFGPCPSDANRCADPLKPVTVPPTPVQPTASFCVPLASERACYALDLSDRPEWVDDVPVITITAGSSELRNVTVSMYERPAGSTATCDEIADMNRCNPLNYWFSTYIPAGGSVTIDGQTGQATIDCNDGAGCQTASNVFGSNNGGPVVVNPLNCAEFCVCVETDPNLPPAADATFSLSTSGRGY